MRLLVWKVLAADGTSPYGIESDPQSTLRQPATTPGAPADLPPGVTPTAPASVEIDRLAPVVKALKAAGIKAWGWHSLRGDDPDGEAQQAIQRIRSLGLDGYALDAEVEYKQIHKAQAALRFMEALRKAYPSLPVALSSYGRPSYHPELPWEEFLCYADFDMPQVYWINAHNPDVQLRNSVSEYTARPNARAIVPVGGAISLSGRRPSAGEISLFRDTMRALNLPAASYWVWDQARSPGNKDLWAARCRWETTSPLAPSRTARA